MHPGPTLARAAAVCLIAAAVVGCGSNSGPGSDASTTRATTRAATRDASLILDFTPNAVHAGIYSAIARHYAQNLGLRLHVTAPTATTDSIKLLETGKLDFAVLDIHDLALARERGQDVVGIMAVVQRPLSSVVAAPDIGSPRALEGKTVGITGVPSDTAVLRSVVAGSGGNPARVKTITIGFNAVADLLAGRVAGATAFWNDEGQAVQSKRPGFHIFRVEDYGAPAYPELVLCATRRTLRGDRKLAQLVVDALVRGYQFTLSDPRGSAADLEHAVPALDPKLVATQLRGLLPAFRGAGGRVGALDLARLRAWSAWEARFGIVPRPPVVTRTFDPTLTARSGQP